MKKINICYITKDLDIHGITSVILNYCERLNKDIYDITILAGPPIDDSCKQKLIDNGITLIVLPPKRDNPFKYFHSVRKNLKKKFAVVHVHGNSSLIFGELFISLLSGVKIRIAHSHNTKCDFPILHRLMKPLLNSIATVRIGCGEEAGKWMFGKRTFNIIPNGIDIKKYSFNENKRNKIRKKMNFENKIVLGHVGKFNEQKNHKFLINMFEKLYRNNHNIILWLIGDGPNYEKIVKMSQLLDCKNNIVFSGAVHNVYELYNAMDIFVLPSFYEGIPVVLIEAQANGLHCIVSNTIEQRVNINDNMDFVDIDDYDKWVKIILEQKSHNQRKALLKEIEYDINHSIQKLEKIYQCNYNIIKNKL